MGLLIFYGIIQQQLPCNFSITCLMGMPTLRQALSDGWTGKPALGKLYEKVGREMKREKRKEARTQ
jgi:hypothetical protein